MKNKQNKLSHIRISDITVDSRYRVDMGNIESLADSIKEKGVLQPITLSPDFHLLAGHRRYSAAKLLNMNTIPALIRDITGEADAREIELFENIHRKSFTWQEEAKLIREIDRLYKEKNQDWSGRRTAELVDQGKTNVAKKISIANALDAIPELSEYKTMEDAFKVVKSMEEQVIIDELYKRQQAEHQKYIEAMSADEKNASNVNVSSNDMAVRATLAAADRAYCVQDTFLGMSKMPTNGKIDIIECDPPYGISLNKVKMSNSPNARNDSYNEVPTEEYEQFLGKLTSELYRVSSPNTWLIFWYGPTWHTQVLAALQKANWSVDIIPCIWVKPAGQSMQPEMYFGRCYEPFFLCRKGSPVMNHRGRSNVFHFDTVPPSKKYHPTERPVSLICELLDRLGTGMTKVFIPFLGSGATLRACYKIGFDGAGFDISDEYRKKFMLSVEQDTKEMLARENEEG